jgi:hypothetical protein
MTHYTGIKQKYSIGKEIQMMPLLAKGIVEVNSAGGDHVVVDPMGPIYMGSIYLFLILLPFILVLFLAYYRNKYRHQQILAAMEKGLPITDLIARPQIRNREVNWVRSLSAGIGFLFVGIVIPIICFVFGMINPSTPPDKIFGMLIIPTGVCGLGLILLMRGILQKNYEKQKQKENTAPPQ